jgi:hypothetical protein
MSSMIFGFNSIEKLNFANFMTYLDKTLEHLTYLLPQWL